MPFRFAPRLAGVAIAALALAACTLYRAQPLPTAPKPADLSVDISTLPFPRLAAHRFDPSDGLDCTEIAMLAVANNPALKLARDDAGISHAQAFAAGLLPNPTLSYGVDAHHNQGGSTAYNASLGYDLNTLVTHAATRAAGQASAREADLALLWQEWQTVADARVQCIRSLSQTQLLVWLTRSRDLLAQRRDATDHALRAGNLSLDSASTALLAWQDAARQVHEAERQQAQNAADLNALLGLPPDTALQLVDNETTTAPSDADITAALARLDQRPDLLALRSAHDAEDARYRQAILAQFPPVNLSITKARDKDGESSAGFAITISLPIFDHNQGNVAVEKATRQRLYDDYQQRLNSAQADIARLRTSMRLEAQQLEEVDAALPTLDAAAEHARSALAAGNIDGPASVAFISASLQKHQERETLAETLTEQRIALSTLAGGDFTTTDSGTSR